MSDLDKIRDNIDTIDQELINLLVRRFKLVKKMKQAKRAAGQPAIDEARWNEIQQRVARIASENGLNETGVQSIFDQIHRYSLKYIYEE